MEMKQYLLDTFAFNDMANRNMIHKIGQLPEPEEPVRFVSHLINSQIKWLARIEQYPADPNLDWWEPRYRYEELESGWEKSLVQWTSFLKKKDEKDLFSDVLFIGKDGSHWSAPLKDIVLQLNYHSFHHRAQIQMMIRSQGVEPDFIDYIGVAYKRLGQDPHK